MRPLLAACALALVALSACGKKEDAKIEAPAAPVVEAPAGFAHDPAFDAAGYYQPAQAVQVGNLKLDHIAIGAPSDFDDWESGKHDGVFGPIVLEFEDVASPTASNELGENVHTVRKRVLPQSYRVFPGEVSFRAADPTFGEVAFDGRFDQAAFAEAHKSGSSGDAPVLTGNLKLGSNTIAGLAFTFFAGD